MSAATIIQLTSELVTGVRKFYKSAKNQPKDVAALLDELNNFGIVLESLKELSRNADAVRAQNATVMGATSISSVGTDLSTAKKLMTKGAPLDVCFEEMAAFQVKLLQDQSKIKKSLKWPFQKDEVLSVVSRLRRLKSILDTAISKDQL